MSNPAAPPMPWDEYLAQDENYWSASQERWEPIKTTPSPYALRALAKLERAHGFAVLETPLAQALKQRAELGVGAEVVEFDTPHGHRMMLRDKTSKTFKAGAARTRSKKKTV